MWLGKAAALWCCKVVFFYFSVSGRVQVLSSVICSSTLPICQPTRNYCVQRCTLFPPPLSRSHLVLRGTHSRHKTQQENSVLRATFGTPLFFILCQTFGTFLGGKQTRAKCGPRTPRIPSLVVDDCPPECRWGVENKVTYGTPPPSPLLLFLVHLWHLHLLPLVPAQSSTKTKKRRRRKRLKRERERKSHYLNEDLASLFSFSPFLSLSPKDNLVWAVVVTSPEPSIKRPPLPLLLARPRALF